MAQDIIARGMAAGARSDLAKYYYKKDEVDALVAGMTDPAIVVALPVPSEATRKKLYMVGPKGTAPNVYYEEYLTIRSGNNYVWEQIGSTSIDLTKYYTKEESDARYVQNKDLYISTEVFDNLFN